MKPKQFGAASSIDGKVDQALTKKNAKPNDKAIDPDAVLPKKSSQQGSSKGQKATLSPIMQVMKAVTASAINPKKKKAPVVPNGPSKANNSFPAQRTDTDDGGSPKKGKV